MRIYISYFPFIPIKCFFFFVFKILFGSKPDGFCFICAWIDLTERELKVGSSRLWSSVHAKFKRKSHKEDLLHVTELRALKLTNLFDLQRNHKFPRACLSQEALKLLHAIVFSKEYVFGHNGRILIRNLNFV